MSVKMLDVRMVANRLGVGTTTIYRLIKSGQIQSKKLGPRKGYRIPESEIMMIQRYGLPETEAELE